MPERVSFWLTLMWGFIVFVINLFALQTFIIIACKYEDKLQHQMSHDMLTGLPNRYFMSDHLEDIQSKGSLKGYWAALADIDDFKTINDTCGHNCGDYVLNTIAKIFSKNKDVLCCRWGGEEFLFIGKSDGDPQKGYEYLESLRQEVAKHPFVFGGKVLSITATFGMAEYKEGQAIDAWISEADALLYKGKKKGKNQVMV